MKKKTPEEYVVDIQEACKNLGWYIALCDTEGGITGLVVGRLDYIEELLPQLENGEQFEIWENPLDTDTKLH